MNRRSFVKLLAGATLAVAALPFEFKQREQMRGLTSAELMDFHDILCREAERITPAIMKVALRASPWESLIAT